MMLQKVFSFFAIAALCGSLAACDSPEQKEAKYIDRGNKLFAQGSYAKARVEYKNAARIAPTDPQVKYLMATVDEAEGDIRNALANYFAAEQQNTHFEPAVFKLAQFFLAAENYEEARKRIDLLLADNPSNAQAHALRAALLLRLKDLGTAEKEVRLAFQIDPHNVIAFSVLTGIYTAKNNYDLAFKTIEEGITQNPQEVSLLLLKSMLHAQKEDMVALTDTFEKIFKIRPQDLVYRIELANILIKAKKIDEAEGVLRKAVAASPNEWGIKHKLVQFLSEQRDMQTAETVIRAYIKEFPKKSDLYLWLTELYLQHNATDKAIALLEEVVARDSDDQTTLTANASLARIRFLQGDRSLTEKLVALVLKKDSGNTEALFLRAQLAFEQGDLQNAVSDLRAIIRNAPKTTKAYQLLSEIFLNQGHINLAIDTLNQLLSIQPADIKSRTRLAQMYAVRKDTRLALDTIKIVTKADPTYSVGWESTARIALDAKNWDYAEEAIAKLAALEGQRLTALFLKAQLLASTNKREESLALYKQVINENPSAPLAEYALSSLVKVARDVERLPETALYIQKLQTTNPTVSSLLGEVLLALNNPKEAANAFDLAIERKASFQAPYINRARLFLSEGKPDRALAVLQMGSTVVPTEIQAPLMLADILSSQGKYEEAIALYENLLTRNPELDIAANNIAQIIADLPNRNEAALEKARGLAERFAASSNPYYLDTLSWVYYRQGKVTQALTIEERAMKMIKQPPAQMLYHYGAILMKAGKTVEAKAALTGAISETSNYSGIDEARKLYKEIKE